MEGKTTWDIDILVTAMEAGRWQAGDRGLNGAMVIGQQHSGRHTKDDKAKPTEKSRGWLTRFEPDWQITTRKLNQMERTTQRRIDFFMSCIITTEG